MNVRERLEAMLSATEADIQRLEGNPLRVVPQQQRALLRALLAAIEQRGHGYAYVWNVLGDKAKADIDARLKRDDARLLAIIEGREEP